MKELDSYGLSPHEVTPPHTLENLTYMFQPSEEMVAMRPTVPPVQHQQVPFTSNITTPDVAITVYEATGGTPPETGLPPPPSYEEVKTGTFTEINLGESHPGSERMNQSHQGGSGEVQGQGGMT